MKHFHPFVYWVWFLVFVPSLFGQANYKNYVDPRDTYAGNPVSGLEVWDPIQPVNEAFFEFNDVVIKWVIDPSGQVYGYVVPREAQKRIENINQNLQTPVRLVNNLLQFRMLESSSVLSRFVLNSTVGIAGIFDFASYTEVGFLQKPPEQTFSKTLGHWGVPQGFYLVLPFMGPSSARQATGGVVDSQLDIAGHIFFPLDAFLTYNNLVYEAVPLYLNFTKDSPQAYIDIRDYFPLMERSAIALEQHEPEDNQKLPAQEDDQAMMETLGFLRYSGLLDKKFVEQAQVKTMKFAQQEKSFQYGLWLQKERAPLVVVLPGFGGSYRSSFALVTAKKFYQAGFSVLTVSNVFHGPFARALPHDSPGYAPWDVHILYQLLRSIIGKLRKEHPHKIEYITSVGYSLGALHNLFIAKKEQRLPVSQKIFDRYVAVNPPGNLSYALQKLDSFLYESYGSLSEEERTQRQLKTLGTLLGKTLGDGLNPWNTPFDLQAEDARFMIGLYYQRTLMHMLHKQHLVSFHQYFQQRVVPFFKKKYPQLKASSEEELYGIIGYNNSFWVLKKTLQNTPSLRVFINANDPLLDPSSLQLLKELVPKDQLFMFERGGHLGNLQKNTPKIIQAATIQQP